MDRMEPKEDESNRMISTMLTRVEDEGASAGSVRTDARAGSIRYNPLLVVAPATDNGNRRGPMSARPISSRYPTVSSQHQIAVASRGIKMYSLPNSNNKNKKSKIRKKKEQEKLKSGDIIKPITTKFGHKNDLENRRANEYDTVKLSDRKRTTRVQGTDTSCDRPCCCSVLPEQQLQSHSGSEAGTLIDSVMSALCELQPHFDDDRSVVSCQKLIKNKAVNTLSPSVCDNPCRCGIANYKAGPIATTPKVPVLNDSTVRVAQSCGLISFHKNAVKDLRDGFQKFVHQGKATSLHRRVVTSDDKDGMPFALIYIKCERRRWEQMLRDIPWIPTVLPQATEPEPERLVLALTRLKIHHKVTHDIMHEIYQNSSSIFSNKINTFNNLPVKSIAVVNNTRDDVSNQRGDGVKSCVGSKQLEADLDLLVPCRKSHQKPLQPFLRLEHTGKRDAARSHSLCPPRVTFKSHEEECCCCEEPAPNPKPTEIVKEAPVVERPQPPAEGDKCVCDSGDQCTCNGQPVGPEPECETETEPEFEPDSLLLIGDCEYTLKDLQWIERRAFIKMQSQLTQTMSGFKILKKPRYQGVSFEDLITFYEVLEEVNMEDILIANEEGGVVVEGVVVEGNMEKKCMVCEDEACLGKGTPGQLPPKPTGDPVLAAKPHIKWQENDEDFHKSCTCETREAFEQATYIPPEGKVYCECKKGSLVQCGCGSSNEVTSSPPSEPEVASLAPMEGSSSSPSESLSTPPLTPPPSVVPPATPFATDGMEGPPAGGFKVTIGAKGKSSPGLQGICCFDLFEEPNGSNYDSSSESSSGSTYLIYT